MEHSVADLSGEQRQGRQVASYLLDTLSRSTVGTYDASSGAGGQFDESLIDLVVVRAERGAVAMSCGEAAWLLRMDCCYRCSSPSTANSSHVCR